MLSLWIQTAYATSFLPQIPALLSAWGRREDLDRLYKRVIRAVLWVNGPLLVGLAAGAEGIMELFGSRFGSGAALLLIVTVGQWLNSTTALAEDFLPLSGRSRLALMNNLGALMLTGIGAYVLGQSFGIGGVALAYAGATALLNVVRAVQVRRLYGISIPLGTAVKMTGIGAVVLSIWFFLDLQLSAAHLLLGAALCGLATFLLMTVVANRAERSALIALIHPRAVVSGPAGQT
jgi:O-antigen/teichoic acid export membrane protein